jgi:hypothetical protein
MQHFPAREAVPRAEMIGAEDLEGRERQVLFDLGGKEIQRPLTDPKVLTIVSSSSTRSTGYRGRAAVRKMSMTASI